MLWIYTPVWKRIIRTVIGVSLAFFFQWMFLELVAKTNDMATRFFFGFSIPMFCASFFIFGFYPIICKWMHLVLRADEI